MVKILRASGKRKRTMESLFFLVLVLVFFGSIPFEAHSETVEDLEAGYKNCIADWGRLYNEYAAGTCFYIDYIEKRCDEWKPHSEERYRECMAWLARCRSLPGQIKSVSDACREIEKELGVARTNRQRQPQGQTHSGILNTFRVECNPSRQVEVGGAVTCTAHGIYSSNNTKLLDLTHVPGTTWQNGPSFSTQGLRPGQTVVVRAARGSVSDGVTITVIAGQGELRLSKASIRLDVMDDMNRPVSNARISIGSMSKTGSSVTFSNLDRGQYNLKVTAQGYNNYEMPLDINSLDSFVPIRLTRAELSCDQKCRADPAMSRPGFDFNKCVADCKSKESYTDYFKKKKQKMSPEDARDFQRSFEK